ncbi:MAG: peptide-binding protein [Helicobacteraceae bacterium]|jgi:peptide/nickel transport system substrate-binding protein|nr:peptide-binding protein [Helicobacteraceae bacterium]
MKNRKKTRAWICGALAVLLPVLCAAQDALNLTLSGFPARLNPLLATDTVSGELSSYLFDGLVKYDKNANIVPEIAESWSFADDRTLIFKLRKDRLWHDKTPVTARDAVFLYETAIGDRVFTPYASIFRMVESVEAIDDFTLKVVYRSPYFKALETWMMPLIPEHILRDDPNLMGSIFNTRPIGNSFYKLEELTLSRNLNLFKFEDFSPYPPAIDRVVFEYIQDSSMEFLLLKSGQIHIGSLSAMQLERQIDDAFNERYKIVENGAFAYTYLGFNLRNPKFQDSRVREALSYAIDRQELVDVLFLGHGRVCNSPFLEGAIGYNDTVVSPKQDIAKAKALLKEVGYDENNPLTFTISTNSTNPIRLYAAEMLQHQLAKSGVKVTLRVMEWQALLSRVVKEGNFETILLGWTLPLTPDPYSIWHSASDKVGGFNYIGYKNDEVDRLIEEAEATSDRKKVGAIFEKIGALIVRDNPYLFLYIPNDISAVSKKITPLEITRFGFSYNRIDWRIDP